MDEVFLKFAKCLLIPLFLNNRSVVYFLRMVEVEVGVI